jgi:iron-sulfur cluster repair protein YtfE (RIC family)
MDALELLKEDHRKVKSLFQRAETAEASELGQICEQINKELEMHAHIEETVFYPAMQKYDELKDMVEESLEEHEEIKNLLADMSADDDELESKLEELKETVEHHAEDEEEGEMFPKIRQLLNQQELQRLGEQLQDAKGQHQPQRKVS